MTDILVKLNPDQLSYVIALTGGYDPPSPVPESCQFLSLQISSGALNAGLQDALDLHTGQGEDPFADAVDTSDDFNNWSSPNWTIRIMRGDVI